MLKNQIKPELSSKIKISLEKTNLHQKPNKISKKRVSEFPNMLILKRVSKLTLIKTTFTKKQYASFNDSGKLVPKSVRKSVYKPMLIP